MRAAAAERDRQRQQAQAGAEDERRGSAPSPPPRRRRGPAGRPSAPPPGRRRRPARRRRRSARPAARSRRRPAVVGALAPRRVVSNTAARISPSARWRSGSVRSGRRRITIWAEWLLGKRKASLRLGRVERPPRVEDDAGDEVGVGEARQAGDPVLGGDADQDPAQLGRGPVGREPADLVVDRDHRLVEEGRGTRERLDRPHPRQLGAWPRDRLARPSARSPPGNPPAAAAAPGSRSGPGGCSLPSASTTTGSSPNASPHMRARLRRRRVRVDQRPGPRIGRQPRRADARCHGKDKRHRQDRPGMASGPSCYRAHQSIESGPLMSALRNCETKALSESNSSSFGPDSTILPFHSTARKSAIRRAVLRSWLIVR